jgi:hypothetical protein
MSKEKEQASTHREREGEEDYNKEKKIEAQ